MEQIKACDTQEKVFQGFTKTGLRNFLRTNGWCTSGSKSHLVTLIMEDFIGNPPFSLKSFLLTLTRTSTRPYSIFSACKGTLLGVVVSDLLPQISAYYVSHKWMEGTFEIPFEPQPNFQSPIFLTFSNSNLVLW